VVPSENVGRQTLTTPSMSAVTDAPHRLLLSHFSNWSQTKGRDVDVPLLESLLDLRAAYDDLEPTLWPAGSVQDLLLRLVPAKGPTEPLLSEATVDALDAYFRFLRNTGRMSARSAAPADLTKEARRSAKKMDAAARDRTNWSPGKNMIDFGSSIGVSLDDLSSTDELQDRLDQIASAWNDLPIHERQRLDPPKDNLSGQARAMAAYQTDDEIEALIRSFAYEIPEGELPPPSEVAPIIRQAGLLRKLEALTRWVEPRAEVTATRVLRPAPARQAFADLGLLEWRRESLRVAYAGLQSELPAEEIESMIDTLASSQSWRSARECEALDRLWNAALSAQVIRIDGRWAYAHWPDQLDDEGIVNLGIAAGLDVILSYLDDDFRPGTPLLGYALLRSYVRRPRSVPLQEIEEFALSWTLPPSDQGKSEQDMFRRWIRSNLRRILFGLSDLGVFSPIGNKISLTAWGDLLVSAWLNIWMDVFDDEGLTSPEL
jgi:hypothetical protein